ncbi:MAG: Fic family protein [Xanthobacteraceae bacterium]
MYEVENDTIYCYPGTDVLRNKLDIKDAAKLANFEAEISNQRAQEPIPEGDLDYAHYCALHKHLFQDVYDWAGELRKIRIGKGGNWFCFPENIDAEMTKLFASLAEENNFAGLSKAELAKKTAHFLAELNAIHPFREGNGRTQLSFLTIIAEEAGHSLDFEKLEPEKLLSSIIESFAGDEDGLGQAINDFI